jgi:hypothetical protein
MFIHINRVASAVLMVILLFGLGLAAEGTKAPPVKTAVTAVEQQKSLTSRAAVAEPATGEQINWQVISSGGTKGNQLRSSPRLLAGVRRRRRMLQWRRETR